LRIARVFPRRTTATPDDELAFTGPPPKVIPEIDEVHVSVAFTYDLEKAYQLVESWMKTGRPVKVGGPAFNVPGGNFMPGLYLRPGFIITSRGCNNQCWFCSVPKREGALRELPITEGHIVLDDNLLACSETHIRAVFDMLKTQKERPIFTGGLEARLLRSWHVDLLRESKAQRFYCAYDTPRDYEPLVQAGKLLEAGGITRKSRKPNCYVLIGYRGDTIEKAEKRLRNTWAAGFAPFAMLYRDEQGEVNREWRQFQRLWARPHSIFSQLKADTLA